MARQPIEDTGPLTRERMQTVDEEVTAEALAFMDIGAADGKPLLRVVELHPHAHLHP